MLSRIYTYLLSPLVSAQWEPCKQLENVVLGILIADLVLLAQLYLIRALVTGRKAPCDVIEVVVVGYHKFVAQVGVTHELPARVAPKDTIFF